MSLSSKTFQPHCLPKYAKFIWRSMKKHQHTQGRSTMTHGGNQPRPAIRQGFVRLGRATQIPGAYWNVVVAVIHLVMMLDKRHIRAPLSWKGWKFRGFCLTTQEQDSTTCKILPHLEYLHVRGQYRDCFILPTNI